MTYEHNKLYFNGKTIILVINRVFYIDGEEKPIIKNLSTGKNSVATDAYLLEKGYKEIEKIDSVHVKQ